MSADHSSSEGRRAGRRLSLRHPRLVSCIAMILLLGIWGTWAGPGWDPQPMRTLLVPESQSTRIEGANPTASLGTYEVEVRQVEVPMRDGTTVHATLKTPVGLDGLAPAMVFVHGTGTDSHTSFEDETDLIASTGVATLVTDKRTNNYTTTHRDYLELAKDYEDAFDFLVGIDGVDPKLTGLYTVSEGCYVGPIVAAGDSRVAFVVFVSAPVLPIRTQGALAADTYLRNLGAPKQITNLIAKLVGQRFDDGSFEYIDFDVSEYQQEMTMPVLMVYGTNDMSMPVIQGPLLLRDDLRQASNSAFTVRYYEGADHGLKIGDDLLRQPMQDVSDWVNGMPSTAHAEPHIAGANPSQPYMAETVASAPAFASGMSLLVTLAAGALLVCAAALASLLGRLRIRGRRLVDLRGCAPSLNAASLGIVAGCCAFTAYIILLAYYATSYQRNSFVVQSGWLACQFVALLAAWLFVRAQFALWRTPGRFSWPARLTILSATTGQVVLFLSLGYWGLYPSLR
ncbi:MAG: alpha/beta hydrolase [Actinomycetaceae bacterium]|nr:alpha/beta hydrolase [Actinomycetaceae bacterium]